MVNPESVMGGRPEPVPDVPEPELVAGRASAPLPKFSGGAPGGAVGGANAGARWEEVTGRDVSAGFTCEVTGRTS